MDDLLNVSLVSEERRRAVVCMCRRTEHPENAGHTLSAIQGFLFFDLYQPKNN